MNAIIKRTNLQKSGTVKNKQMQNFKNQVGNVHYITKLRE